MFSACGPSYERLIVVAMVRIEERNTSMPRREDPFELRARELCLAAGQDPESRILKPGSDRGMPAWCLYRTAAQAEISALKAAEVFAVSSDAEFINPRPQAPAYQNAHLHVVGDHEANTILQMKNCMTVGNVVGGALCADGHLGYAQAVGGVIAYEGQISMSGVGYDIGCGNFAVRLDTTYDSIRSSASKILADIREAVSFGMERIKNAPAQHALFDDEDVWDKADMKAYRQKARAQLGTVGGGNHYVDLLYDEAGFVWIGVHFGSRGLGHTAATKYISLAGGKDAVHAPPAVVDDDSELGERYLAAMSIAGSYAYAGREWVVERVRQIIGGAVTDSIHNHHNFAWKENHGGRDLWVVRKGATPAFPGQRGFVGGSMGDDAVILEGVDSLESKSLFYSTVHGAGRTFGRHEAKRRFTRAQMEDELQRRGVLLSGADLDESPMAYRRLPEGLAHHAGTVKVLHTLRPFAVAMAGQSEFDPFKD
jgi:tRNA-splicing ligase RtcB